MSRVKGAKRIEFVGTQCGESAFASQQLGDPRGEARERPDVAAAGRVEVEAQLPPLLMAAILNLFHSVEIPGDRYVFVTLALVPISFAHGTRLNDGRILVTGGQDRKSTRLNSSHQSTSRMPSSA